MAGHGAGGGSFRAAGWPAGGGDAVPRDRRPARARTCPPSGAGSATTAALSTVDGDHDGNHPVLAGDRTGGAPADHPAVHRRGRGAAGRARPRVPLSLSPQHTQRIDRTKSLDERGVDSLMGMELLVLVRKRFQHQISPMELVRTSGRGVRPPARVPRPRPEPLGVVPGAQAPGRAAALLVGRPRPEQDQQGRRGLPPHPEVDPGQPAGQGGARPAGRREPALLPS